MISQCAYYILSQGGEALGDNIICYKCNNNYYRYCNNCYNNPASQKPTYQCIKVPETVSHCIEYESYINSTVYCNLCESAEYYLYEDKCYKIPKQINNCEIY